MLIEIGATIINTDHIVSMDRIAGTDGAAQWSITLVTGKTIKVGASLIDEGRICGTIVPAPPGLTLVEAFLPSPQDDDRRVQFCSTPVVAFRIINPTAAPEPIGGMGEPLTKGGYEYAVVQPNGQCFNWERAWDNLDEFKGEQQTVADARRRPEPSETAAAAIDPPDPAPTFIGSDEADPITELRARILAEPIRPITGKALWRDGQGFAETIEAVRRAHPAVHAQGIGHNPKARAEMTDPGCIEEFKRALRFLSHAGHRFRRPPAPNRKRSSYSWKHAAERVMGDYVSNGMLIAAAYALGFIVVTEKDSPNAWINLSEEAISLDPGKGAT